MPSRLNNRRPIRILVVDNDAASQELAVLILTRLGDDAGRVNSGARAFDRLQRRKYDVVLMDIDAPELDGMETSRRIRREFGKENQPWIVALSAHPLIKNGQELRDAGIQDHICKPPEEAELARALDRFFSSSPEPRDPGRARKAADAPLWALPEAFQELLADGEQDSVAEFSDLFLEGLPLLMRQLEQASADMDADSALKLLHQLKGSSWQIGAERLGTVAAEAESFVRNSPSRVGDAAGWLAGVRACLALTETEVRIHRDGLR